MDVQRDGFRIAKHKTIAVDRIKALDVLPVRGLVGRHGAALDSLKNKPVKLAIFVEVKIIEHPDVQHRVLSHLNDCGHVDEVRLILLFKVGASKQVVPGRVMKSEYEPATVSIRSSLNVEIARRISAGTTCDATSNEMK